jgi:hypothetical protein
LTHRRPAKVRCQRLPSERFAQKIEGHVRVRRCLNHHFTTAVPHDEQVRQMGLPPEKIRDALDTSFDAHLLVILSQCHHL